MTADLAT